MQGRTSKSAKPKNNVSTAISNGIRKIFSFFREVFHKLGELIIEAMKLLMEIFKIFTNILTHPTAGITFAVCLFLFVCTITLVQWVQIGLWGGSWLGIHSTYGIGPGLLGAVVGVGINVFQLTPEMWKIKRSWAIAYEKMGIKSSLPCL
ncbi:MAG: hypothetical protein ACYTXE_17545 [Nostoc sp.]|uniref:hypothetical protein n=1 Tax=Nostoc sp. TaxID=1180 RepID=UPI002FF5B192